jgi:hypothetical protein
MRDIATLNIAHSQYHTCRGRPEWHGQGDLHKDKQGELAVQQA